MATILFLLFILFMAIGVPIAISLGFSAVVALLVTGNFPYVAGIHRLVSGIDSYVQLAIPFFILAGGLMNSGSITKRLFRLAKAITNPIPGNLGHANVIASIIFAGKTGSAVADAGGVGQICTEAMIDEGYDPNFSAAITASSSIIGPIIPPSIPLVVFGAMAEVSIGALFLGGLIPGALIGISIVGMIYYFSKKRNYPKGDFSLKELLISFKRAFLSLMAPIIIIVGMFTGFITPTEAAAVAVVYAFILCAILYRDITLKKLYQTILDAAVTTATITIILGAAAAFAWIIAIEGIPQAITGWLLDITTNPMVILLLLNITLLIFGMFMESLSLLTILVPFLVPIMAATGINPVHMGLVVVLNLMIGLVTPPAGICLFVVSKYKGVSLELLFKEILPFLIPLLIVLLLVTYVPSIVLWLPNLFF